jgi:hypothetical protein
VIRTVVLTSPNLLGAETYLDLMRDVPHWCFELTVEVVSGVAAWPLARRLWRWALRRHDEVEHPTIVVDSLVTSLSAALQRIEALEARASFNTQEVDE